MKGFEFEKKLKASNPKIQKIEKENRELKADNKKLLSKISKLNHNKEK